jgi:hypothetical protein
LQAREKISVVLDRSIIYEVAGKDNKIVMAILPSSIAQYGIQVSLDIEHTLIVPLEVYIRKLKY